MNKAYNKSNNNVCRGGFCEMKSRFRLLVKAHGQKIMARPGIKTPGIASARLCLLAVILIIFSAPAVWASSTPIFNPTSSSSSAQPPGAGSLLDMNSISLFPSGQNGGSASANTTGALGGAASAASAAGGCQMCACVEPAHAQTRAVVMEEHEKTKKHVTDEYEKHRIKFMLGYFFYRHLDPAIRSVATQTTTESKNHSVNAGATTDATMQLNAQRKMQEQQARSTIDSQPNTSLCRMATLSDNMQGASAAKETAVQKITKQSLDRQMLVEGSSGEGGRIGDVNIRYASLQEMNENPAMKNADVDVFSAIYQPMTLDADYMSNDVTDSKKRIASVMDNLVGDELLQGPQSFDLNDEKFQNLVTDSRALANSRSFSATSLSYLIGSRTQGAKSGEYASAVMMQNGATQQDAQKILGERPSFEAMNNLVAKKNIAGFIPELYDSTANVSRASAALQAQGMSQSVELLETLLRSGNLVSRIGAQSVDTHIQDIQNQLNPLGTQGPRSGSTGGRI